ncbi:MAG: hypothetical protein WAR99_08750, partial [Saprospiraceae bacterium]
TPHTYYFLYSGTGKILFVTIKLNNMKHFIFTIAFFLPLLLKAQIYNDVPLSLSYNKIKCDSYYDGVQIASTSNGYTINSILRAKYPIVTGKKITSGGKEDEKLIVFGTYFFDEKMKLIDSLQQFINYGIPLLFTKEFMILDHYHKGHGEVLAESKDVISLSQTGIIEDGFKTVHYPANDPGIVESFIRKPIAVAKVDKEYLQVIYNNDIKTNFVGKIKGFQTTKLTLKNDADRAKAKKAFFDKGIVGEYTAVEKVINFDYFTDDPKHDKLKLMNSYGHELTGNVIACFAHPEKLLFKKFSFWGFDPEGKVTNSYYKDFTEGQEWPSIAVINDSEPLIYSRPAKIFNYFFPSGNGRPLYIVAQDKDGKVISDKTYPANVPGGSLLKSKINDDGSQSLLTIARWKAGTTLNSFYLDTEDKLTATSYFLEPKIEDPFLPTRYYGFSKHFEIANDNKVSMYQKNYIKKTTTSNTVGQTEQTIYEGFLLVTSDKTNKTTDVLLLDKGLRAEGNSTPFELESYDVSDGSTILVLSKKVKITLHNVLTAGQEYVLISVDKDGKFINKEKIQPAFTTSESVLRPTNVPDLFYTTPDVKTQSIMVVRLKKPE